MIKVAQMVYIGMITGDWRLLRYDIAAHVWLTGLRLMRWAWRFSPDFETQTTRMVKHHEVTGNLGFEMQPPVD